MSRAAWTALAGGGWTSWPGGACPVPVAAVVTALLNNGSTVTGRAGEWSWKRNPEPDGFEEPDEIVAFRLR